LSLSERVEGAVVPAAVGLTLVAGWYNWRAWRQSTAAALAAEPAAPAASAALASAAAMPAPGGACTVRPRISVLVAAWNEADFIEQHIASFKALTYPDRQLVLCAGGPDGTFERALLHAAEDVVVIEQMAGEGKQHALARCFAAASGDIIVLTDADCLFEDEALSALIEPIVAGRAAVTTGFAEPLREDRRNPFVRYQWLTFVATLPAQAGPRDGVLGRNCALRRDVVEKLRPFDIPAATGTDYVLSMTLKESGYPILGVPASTIPTRYPATPSAYVRMWRRWIKNVLIHAPRHGARRELAATLASVGLAWFTLATPLAAPLVGRSALVAPAAALAVATMNRVRRLAIGGQRAGTRPSWRLIAASPLMALLDQAAAVLALYDAIAPSRRSKWR
jgi:Glycosyltransferase like family 2